MGIVLVDVSAKEPTDDGKEDQYEVQRVPAFLDRVWSEYVGCEVNGRRDKHEEKSQCYGYQNYEEYARVEEDGGDLASASVVVVVVG